MAQGGKRAGAGRKKGGKASHTLEAVEGRKLIIERLNKHLGPIAEALIARAKQGDVRAASLLFDQAFGKVGIHEPAPPDYIVNIIQYGADDPLMKAMEAKGTKCVRQ
jgi:hypothetical protein